MALVGMASKPLHVRRLQKALRDWVTNPALFNQPLTSLPVCSIPVYKLPEGSPTLFAWEWRPWRHPSQSSQVFGQLLVWIPERRIGQRETLLATVHPSRVAVKPRFWAGHGTESEARLSPAELGSPSSPRDGLEATRRGCCSVRGGVRGKNHSDFAKSDPGEVKETVWREIRSLPRWSCHIFDMSDEDPHREEEIRKYKCHIWEIRLKTEGWEASDSARGAFLRTRFLHLWLLFGVLNISCTSKAYPVEKNQQMLVRYVLKHGSWFELV